MQVPVLLSNPNSDIEGFVSGLEMPISFNELVADCFFFPIGDTG